MAEKENFYEELDRKTRRSFCTCQTLAGFFLILAIGIVIGVVVVAKKVTTLVNPTRTVNSTSQDATTIHAKLAALNQSQTPGASQSIVITEGQLTSLLIEALANKPSIPLRGVQTAINPDGIILTGTATQFLNTIVTINLVPVVDQGTIKLQIKSIKAGTFAVPDQLSAVLTQSLSSLLQDQLSSLKNITIQSVELGQGQMTISGSQKPS